MFANTARGVAVGWPAANTAVGYKANELQDGATMIAPCFVPVADAATGIDLLDLSVGGTYASGDVVAQTLTYAGLADKTYAFMQERRTGNWLWRDVDESTTVAKGEVVFETGDGLWVQGVDASSVTTSGAVSTDDVTVTLQDGATATGNMMPVAIDLCDLIPGGTYASGNIVVQTLTFAGLADKTYSFMQDRRTGNWIWRDIDEGVTVAEGDVIFESGKGLWVQGVDGATLTFPGVTLN